MGVSEKAIICGEGITGYIPQRGAIVMVDEFFGVEGGESVSGLTIGQDNLFCENGLFSECGVIEHIAQSAALRVGYLCRERGEEVPVGFIGSINKCRLHALPAAGDRLTTRIRVEQQIMDITLVSATVVAGQRPIAECMMKIYLQK